MDSRTRKAINERDGAIARVRTVTWRIGSVAVVGAAVMGAGFANLIPTHLPHVNLGGTGSGSGGGSGDSGGNGGSNGTSTGSGGLQAPTVNPGNGGGGGGNVSSGGS
jgi:hypothetical protein